jgi:hypothetical protein
LLLLLLLLLPAPGACMLLPLATEPTAATGSLTSLLLLLLLLLLSLLVEFAAVSLPSAACWAGSVWPFEAAAAKCRLWRADACSTAAAGVKWLQCWSSSRCLQLAPKWGMLEVCA